jgi:hypothetical protein
LKIVKEFKKEGSHISLSRGQAIPGGDSDD